MIALRFLRAYRMYQPGEVAGFDDALAARLIKDGVAVDNAAAKAEKAAAAKAAAKKAADAEKAAAEKAAAEKKG